jgi:hypothetical protein
MVIAGIVFDNDPLVYLIEFDGPKYMFSVVCEKVLMSLFGCPKVTYKKET